MLTLIPVWNLIPFSRSHNIWLLRLILKSRVNLALLSLLTSDSHQPITDHHPFPTANHWSPQIPNDQITDHLWFPTTNHWSPVSQQPITDHHGFLMTNHWSPLIVQSSHFFGLNSPIRNIYKKSKQVQIKWNQMYFDKNKKKPILSILTSSVQKAALWYVNEHDYQHAD